MPASVLELTDAAAARVRELVAARGRRTLGVRVGVRRRGCSGFSYTLEYADEQGARDEVVEDKGVRILIDPDAVMFLLGSVMDYRKEAMSEGFVFGNPNERGRCGCGESFRV